MADNSKIKVLSLNAYDLGHVTHHEILVRTFPQYFPNIEFRGEKLSAYPFSSFQRFVYKLIRRRVPILHQIGWDYWLFRHNLAASNYGQICLNQLLKTYHPDVLHIHTQEIALLSVALFKKIPAVISIDNTTVLLSRDHPYPACETYKPIIELERRCFSAAAHILTFNDRARDSVIEHYGISPDRVTTVYPGVPMESFPKSERKKQLPEYKPRLLFVGNDFGRKGGYDLVNLFEDELVGKCELDIVTNEVLTLPSVPGLRLHGGLSSMCQQLIECYQRADIFVMPTRDEVLGWVFIEAMAAGLPLIGTKVGAVPEVLRDGYNGILIELGMRDALSKGIHTLIENEDLRLTLGKNGRMLAEQEFDSVLNCQKIAKIFEACNSLNSN